MHRLKIRDIDIVMTRQFKNGNECLICKGDLMLPIKDDFINETKTAIEGECNHIFHYSCIKNQLKNGEKKCPIDKTIWKEKKIYNTVMRNSLPSLTKLVKKNTKTQTLIVPITLPLHTIHQL